VCKGWPIKSSPCTMTFNDLLCFPFLINPLLIPHFEWSVGLCILGHHSSHLVPWKTGQGYEILHELQPPSHAGYVWLICLLGTFRKWDHKSTPIWKGALLGDSSPTTHLSWSLFKFSNVNSFFILLGEGPSISPFSCVSPVMDTQCFFYDFC
jgi:hypothetical protein